MQNGLTALSKIGFREKGRLREQHVKNLLSTLYQTDGQRSRLSSYLYSNISIKPGIGDTDIDRIAKHIYRSLSAANVNHKLSCIYCGNDGAKQAAKYIFPFITGRDKYPNAYSMGKIDSLNFCSKCMLVSFASNSQWLFRASTTKGGVEFISAIMFFSKNADALTIFYTSFIEKDLSPSIRSNMKIFQTEMQGVKLRHQYFYDRTWYAEELLAIFLDFLSNKIKLLKMLDKTLGALLFSFRRKLGTSNPTNIYDSFEVIDDLYPFIKAIARLKIRTRREDSFSILFANLREGGRSSLDIGGFVERNRFFRTLLIYRVINWKSVERLVMLKVSDRRSIPFLKPFITAMLEELSLSTASEIFEKGNRTGWDLGNKMKVKESNPNRLKKMIFDFRRCRTSDDFLSLVNLVQVQTGASITKDNVYAFVNTHDFEIAKPAFLIGFANAIFHK
jgi:hypothetical protein